MNSSFPSRTDQRQSSIAQFDNAVLLHETKDGDGRMQPSQLCFVTPEARAQAVDFIRYRMMESSSPKAQTQRLLPPVAIPGDATRPTELHRFCYLLNVNPEVANCVLKWKQREQTVTPVIGQREDLPAALIPVRIRSDLDRSSVTRHLLAARVTLVHCHDGAREDGSYLYFPHQAMAMPVLEAVAAHLPPGSALPVMHAVTIGHRAMQEVYFPQGDAWQWFSPLMPPAHQIALDRQADSASGPLSPLHDAEARRMIESGSRVALIRAR